MKNKRLNLRLEDTTYFAILYMAKKDVRTSTSEIEYCIINEFFRRYGERPESINWSAHGFGDPDPETNNNK